MIKCKVLLCWLLAAVCLLGGCGVADAAAQTVELETVAPEKAQVCMDASWFSDFDVLDEEVYIKCIVTVECTESMRLQIYGFFPEDEGKLLKDPLLPGQFGTSPDSLQNTAELSPGKNELQIYFIGTFAGNKQKQTRLLPTLYLIEAP